ncbi:MAG: helix-hairpin-helix domain-containing protein [Bacteroidia bacterium]
MWRKIQDYFSFRKAERRALLVLGWLMILFLAIYYLLDFYHPKTEGDFSELKQMVAEYRQGQQLATHDTTVEEYNDFVDEELTTSETTKPRYFKFDPNTASAAEFEELGLKRYVAGNIIKYRSKGGSFKTKDDLSRIYGLDDEVFRKIRPFIDLPEEAERKPDSYSENNYQYESRDDWSKPDEKIIVDINQADSAELTLVRGIGPAFSSRIIAYREQLGGFVAKEQLMEVWGIDSTRYPEIAPQVILNDTSIKRININTAGFDELKNHPYIRYKIANAIVNYREQHGAYSDINELRKIHLINKDQFEKLEIYVVAGVSASE